MTVGRGNASLSDILIEIDEEPVSPVRPIGHRPVPAASPCER